MSRPFLVCLGLALATLALYWPVVHHDFVNYDDSDYVTANPHVQSGLSWVNLKWALATGHASNWHPLTWLSHMLDAQLFGLNAGPQLLVNAMFHLANTILLFLLLRRLTGAHWRSAFVAALFAWHPLHVESVAWISERKDVLSTFFLLLTLLSYGLYVEQTRLAGQFVKSRTFGSATCRHARSATFQYLLALGFFTLGLLSKPMIVTLPFLLLLLDYWPWQRFQLRIDKANLKSLLSLVLEKSAFFLLSAASCVVTFIVQRKGGAVSTALPLGGRIANALVSYVRYIGKLFWPENLSVLYPHPGHWLAWQVLASALILAGIFAVMIWQARRRPYLMAGWLWFFGGLIPVIGLVQVGIQSMADRYTYVPLIGLFIALTWTLADACSEEPIKPAEPGPDEADAASVITSKRRVVKQPTVRGGQQPGKMNSAPRRHEQGKDSSRELSAPSALPRPRPRSKVLAACALLMLAACALLTRRQIGFWRDSETLFLHAVQVTPNNYLAYNNLGYYLSGKGKPDQAMEYYLKSLEINPAYEDALNNMGYALAGKKKFADAIIYYQRALAVRPRHAEVHNNLGNALSESGQLEAAMQHYSIALQENPEHADAHNNLGIALAMQGKLDEAIGHFRAALRFKPNYASAHSSLGNALAMQHKLDEAIGEYRECLRLNPNDPQAHNNLGNALAEQGKPAEAVQQYREALQLNANNPEAHFNLAMVLLRQGNRAEAITHCQEALRLKPDYVEARHQLDLLTKAPAP